MNDNFGTAAMQRCCDCGKSVGSQSLWTNNEGPLCRQCWDRQYTQRCKVHTPGAGAPYCVDCAMDKHNVPAQDHPPTPCCGYEGPAGAHPHPVRWNPYNKVVQCHNCGHVYVPREYAPESPLDVDPDPLDVANGLLHAADDHPCCRSVLHAAHNLIVGMTNGGWTYTGEPTP